MRKCLPSMPRRHFGMVAAAALGTALPVVVGCRPPASALMEEARQKFLQPEAPIEAESLAATYAALQPGSEVVLVARIFSSLGDPFDRSNAAFNVIELPKPGHDHDDPGDCPFCKREMENAATAIVQIVDEQGEVLQVSADKLLGLKKNQDVVVTGVATLVGEVMLVNARAIHILSAEAALAFATRFHS
jgi:hypothetical protein